MAERKRSDARSKVSQAEIRAVLDGFRRVVKVLRLADRAGIKQYGLGSAQIYVLHQLRETSPLSINELADLTSTDQSSVSVVVNKLVEKGLITSTRSSSDARKAELVLSVKGRNILKRIPPPFQESLIESLSRLTPQRVRDLAATLRELAEDVAGAGEHPPMFFEDENEQVSSPSRKRRAKRSRS